MLNFILLYGRHEYSWLFVILLVIMGLARLIYDRIKDNAKNPARKRMFTPTRSYEPVRLKGKFISWTCSTDMIVHDIYSERYRRRTDLLHLNDDTHTEHAAEYENCNKLTLYELSQNTDFEEGAVETVFKGPYAVAFSGVLELEDKKVTIKINRQQFKDIYSGEQVATCMEGAVKYKADSINVDVLQVDNRYIVLSFLNKSTLAVYDPVAAENYSDLEPWYDGIDAAGNVVADFDEKEAIEEYGEYWKVGADENGNPGEVGEDAVPFDLESRANRHSGLF